MLVRQLLFPAPAGPESGSRARGEINVTDMTLERKQTGWDIALGVLLLIAGIIILGNAVLATVASVVFIGWLALVWVANHLISLYGRLRLGIRSERLEIGLKEAVTERAGMKKIDERPTQERRAG